MARQLLDKHCIRQSYKNDTLNVEEKTFWYDTMNENRTFHIKLKKWEKEKNKFQIEISINKRKKKNLKMVFYHRIKIDNYLNFNPLIRIHKHRSENRREMNPRRLIRFFITGEKNLRNHMIGITQCAIRIESHREPFGTRIT